MEKLFLKQVLVVEGKYDRIKLSSIVESMIITTDGFGIFKEEEKRALLSRLAHEKGLLVLTDADGGGLVIRNYLNGIIEKKYLTHIYIPEIPGKERRKKQYSKQGLLGVEGVEIATLYDILKPYATMSCECYEKLTKSRLYSDGLLGGIGSENRRKQFLLLAGLPSNLSSNALTEAVNLLGGISFYERILSLE